MKELPTDSDPASKARRAGAPILDPRFGDFENDHSSTKQRSLLAIAGSLLAEVSVAKLLLSWLIQLVLPAVLLGASPLILTAWINEASGRVSEATGVGAALVVLAALVVARFGWRPLFRLAETNFWSLNALAVQPGYAFWREAIRHVVERSLGAMSGADLARMRSMSCAAAGILLFVVAAVVAGAVWPATGWAGSTIDLLRPSLLVAPTIANAVVITSTYLAVAALVWGAADALADQPLDLNGFDVAPPGARIWRVAHLSDIHVVAERYGFRIESGRAGPRGNARLQNALAALSARHVVQPLDLVLLTGDMTDAGTSAEWAEFFDILAGHPHLASRTLILPGNHDVNIIDRANPARLDLPFSPAKALRRMRALSAIVAAQGDSLCGAGNAPDFPLPRLGDALAQHELEIESFADSGGFRLAARLMRLWNGSFPLILPPQGEDGLGVVVLELERGHQLFLHQRAWNDLVESGVRVDRSVQTISARRLDRRAAPPRHRVSEAGCCVLGAHRDRPHQRNLVPSRSQA